MSANPSGWRPTTPTERGDAAATFTGNKALMLEEALIFEIGDTATTGVEVAAPAKTTSRLGSLARTAPIGLPGLSEPETVRHYTRLSRQNYAIDLGLFPLGSCTMKHNPRLNEKMARLPGFADVHPLQPVDTVQGALEVIHQLAHWLVTLTGMTSVAMSPKAGAHGELCGILAIKAALAAKGEGHRKTILVPESAHGTNPATAAFAGYAVEDIPATADGRVDTAALKRFAEQFEVAHRRGRHRRHRDPATQIGRHPGFVGEPVERGHLAVGQYREKLVDTGMIGGQPRRGSLRFRVGGGNRIHHHTVGVPRR